MCCEDSEETKVPGAAPSDTSMAPQGKETAFMTTLRELADERRASGAKFSPLEDQLINSVQQFQTPEYAQEQVNAAKSEVTGSFAKVRQASEANAASLGLNPNDPRAMSMNRGLDLAQAGATAGAGTSARRNTRQLAFDTLAGVSARGDAKLGQAIGALGTGGSLLNQAQGNQIQWNDAQNRYRLGNRQIDSQAAQNAAAAEDAGWGGIGTAVGIGAAALMMFSSRKLKRDIKPAGDALEQVRAMPARKWTYKEGGPDADEHVGPMAEDVAKATGRGDGVMVNVADLAGTTMAAVQQLDRKVRRLEHRA